ncbi:helix-turn-helix domain-containing protein [Glycomyces albidus]|uniref:helix-turn-helix domain-containing protein n=1 Tax=Glycomyces albidus TaxID=2656774 RepID=UPI00389963FC
MTVQSQSRAITSIHKTSGGPYWVLLQLITAGQSLADSPERPNRCRISRRPTRTRNSIVPTRTGSAQRHPRAVRDRLDIDELERLLTAARAGVPRMQLVAEFGVSRKTIYRLLQASGSAPS